MPELCSWSRFFFLGWAVVITEIRVLGRVVVAIEISIVGGVVRSCCGCDEVRFFYVLFL